MNTELEFIYGGITDEYGYGSQPDGTGELKEGKTYTVWWDFEVYVCTCKKVVFVEDDTMTDMFYIGSGTMVGEEDTGEPFICVYTNENGPAVWAMDESGGHYYVLFAGAETEPTAPIGFIEYMVSPKYRMGKPFSGFIGWKLAQGGGGADGEPALVSSDGYTLQDVNGLNLIPKEGK